MPIKLVATDLDGTLLDPMGQVTPRAVRAIAKAQAAGIMVVPVTGRPPQAMWELASTAGVGPWGVCSNGAVLVDIDARAVVEVETIALEVARRLVDLVHAEVPGIVLAADNLDHFMCENGFLESTEGWEDQVVITDDIGPALGGGCIKLIARRPGWSAAELIVALEVLVAKEAQITTSGLDWVDIGATGITKAYALERLCVRLGFKIDEVVAIGDNHNDLSVLAWAGTALAPQNAVPEVLAMVDRVIESNADHGVARYLEELADSAGSAP